MKQIFKWINVFLASAIFLVAAGIAYVAIPYFGNQALIVRSGSMVPAIGVGSVVVVRPETSLISPQTNKIPLYSKNDIIAFRSENNPDTLITHRVVASEAKENGIFYQTKGDANEELDSWLVREKDIVGRTFFTLPYVGYVLAFAKSNTGFPLLIIIPAVLVMLLELFNVIKELKHAKKTKAIAEIRHHIHHPIKHGEKVHFSGLKILVPILMIGMSIPLAFAFPGDTEKSTDNIFTAAKDFPGVLSESTTPTPTPTPPPDVTPTPDLSGIADHIVISEVQIAGATADDEFTEIYNPTSSSIDLSALPLKLHIINSAGTDNNRALTFVNTAIPAHGFFLIGPSAGYTGSVSLDATYASSGAKLVNNGAVYISTSTAIGKTGLIDLVGFGDASSSDREGTALSNPLANTSVERKALSTSDASSMSSGADVSKGNGFDLNDNSTDFILRVLPQPQNSGSATESP